MSWLAISLTFDLPLLMLFCLESPFFQQSQTVANSLKKSINLTSGLDEIWKKSSFDYISFR